MKKRALFVLCFVLLITSCSKLFIKKSTAPVTEQDSSGRYDYFLTEAIRQKYIGSMDESLDLLKEYIKVDPGKSIAYYEMSQIVSYKGDLIKAKSLAAQAANLEKDNSWLQVYCGGLFANTGNIDSAIYYFEKALILEPQSADIKLMLGGVYLQAGEIQKAERVLKELKSTGLIEENQMYNIVNSLIAAGHLNEAEQWATDLVKENKEEVKYEAVLAEIYRQKGKDLIADSIYKNIIERDPKNGDSQMLVAGYLLEKKDYRNASEFLATIVVNDKIGEDPKIEFVKYVLSDTAYVSDQRVSLEVTLRALESEYSADEKLYTLRPEMYEMLGMNNEAINRYEEIRNLIKNTVYCDQKLMILLAQTRDFEKLFGIAKEFATNYNKSILGKVYYGLSAMELKKYDIAETEFKKAMILAGDDKNMQFNVINMQADLAYRQKMFDKAYEFLDEALMINPNDAGALNNYAYYLAENDKELKRALVMAEKAIKAEPVNGTYLDTYGWVLYKMGKNKSALKAIEKSLSLSPARDAELLEHMGFVLRSMGKCEEAVEYWNEALEADKSKEYLKTEIEKCVIK
jgi:predicted Zn-dependent protease